MKHVKAIVSILMALALFVSAQSFSLLAYAEETENTVYYLGDVNKSGSITAMDARLTLMFAAGTKTPTSEEYYYADYIDDGKISAMDARMILKAAAGATPLLLPTEKPKQPAASPQTFQKPQRKAKPRSKTGKSEQKQKRSSANKSGFLLSLTRFHIVNLKKILNG